MATADTDTTNIALTHQNPNALDRNLIVRFQLEPLEDKEASKRAGHPVFVDTECVYIKTPGALDFVLRKAKDYDRRRFPQHYAAYKAGQAEVASGMPLRDWAHATRADVENLSYLGIRTVEQLAAVPDGNLARIGSNATSLRQKAIHWLENAKSDGPRLLLQAQNEDLQNKLQVMQRAIETLQKNQGIPPQAIVEVPAAPRKHRKSKEATP